MSKRPHETLGSIDPEGNDFAAEFDRIFGPPELDGAATEVTDDDATPPQLERRRDPSRDSRSQPARIGARLVRRPWRWIRSPWPAARIVVVATAAASLIVTTLIMMIVVHFTPWSPGNDLIFDDVTPTGGDMGAHVWAPAFLRDHLLPDWRLSGWSMDWYGGFPIYRFYMVIPALVIVGLDTFLPYGVAFKLVAIFGLVTLPFCCWAFGRLARFRFPIPELFAFAAICFMLNESNSIYGGNVLSVMAGEFSFSMALSCMVLGLGLLARGLDDGKASHLALASVLLALAGVSHGVVLIYTAVTALVFVACRCGADVWRAIRRRAPGSMAARRFLYGLTVGALTLLLAAFWLGPFLFGTEYMTDTKYQPEPSNTYASYWPMIFDQKPFFDVLINTLAIIGLLASVARRHTYGIALGVTNVIAVALVYVANDGLPGIGLLWNPRILPWLYLLRYLMVMIGAVEVICYAVNFVRNRPARRVPGVPANAAALGTVAVVVLVVFGWVHQELPGDGHFTEQGERTYGWGPFHAVDKPADGWANADDWPAYNFSGYEGRSTYPEYYSLIQTMALVGDEVGCGRVLWEKDTRDGSKSKYGTSMALTLLPYWTDGCITSMEGMYFESSGTTPYQYLATDAMGASSSRTVRQLRYASNDAAVGVRYLDALGVSYVMLTREEAVAEADARPELVQIATSGPWHIYQVQDASIVEPLAVQPVVVNDRGGDQRDRFLELGTSWFQHQDEWAAMPATDGPDSWQRIDVEVDQDAVQDGRIDVVRPVQDIAAVELPAVTISNLDIGQQSVEFDVSEPGVPVLVRVSYFPNWEVSGADGPYRIGPNHMVVVPTGRHVEMSFGRSSSDIVFSSLTLIGIVLVIGVRLRGDWNFQGASTQHAERDNLSSSLSSLRS